MLYNGKKKALSTNSASLTGCQYVEECKIDPYLSPCLKLKSKKIKDFNINQVTLNLIEEKVGSSLEHIGIGDNYLNRTQQHRY